MLNISSMHLDGPQNIQPSYEAIATDNKQESGVKLQQISTANIPWKVILAVSISALIIYMGAKKVEQYV